MNCSDGGVLDTTRRFHTASPASIFPARSPTLGSGLGAVVDLLVAGEGVPERVLEVDFEHAANETRPRARDRRVKVLEAMGVPLGVYGLTGPGPLTGENLGRFQGEPFDGWSEASIRCIRAISVVWST